MYRELKPVLPGILGVVHVLPASFCGTHSTPTLVLFAIYDSACVRVCVFVRSRGTVIAEDWQPLRFASRRELRAL